MKPIVSGLFLIALLSIALFSGVIPLQAASPAPSNQCFLTTLSDGDIQLKIGNLSLILPIDSPMAKILKCEPWKDFPNLTVAEIYTGKGGTFAITSETDLFIFGKIAGKLKLLYQNLLSSDTTSKAKKGRKLEVDKIRMKYHLEKTAAGKPAIRWEGSPNVDVLDLPH